MRPQEEIDEEIKILEEMKPKVRHYTAFGDDNHKAIEFQIRVLQEKMTSEKIYDRFDADETHMLDSAIEAWEWMNDEPENVRPSDEWRTLVRE